MSNFDELLAVKGDDWSYMLCWAEKLALNNRATDISRNTADGKYTSKMGNAWSKTIHTATEVYVTKIKQSMFFL